MKDLAEENSGTEQSSASPNDDSNPNAVDNPYSSNVLRNYTLGILTLVYTFNFIDRQLLSILQESIKVDLSLSDSQLGLLTGFAFAMFYVQDHMSNHRAKSNLYVRMNGVEPPEYTW